MSEQGSAFVGRGWAFPVAPTASGGIAMATGATEIEQSIYLILGTHPGERPMRPEFGAPLSDFVFEPADGRTIGRMSYVITSALRRWEPRIVVDDVRIEIDADRPECLLIDILYRISGEYDRRNLLVPFYRIPEGAE